MEGEQVTASDENTSFRSGLKATLYDTAESMAGRRSALSQSYHAICQPTLGGAVHLPFMKLPPAPTPQPLSLLRQPRRAHRHCNRFDSGRQQAELPMATFEAASYPALCLPPEAHNSRSMYGLTRVFSPEQRGNAKPSSPPGGGEMCCRVSAYEALLPHSGRRSSCRTVCDVCAKLQRRGPSGAQALSDTYSTLQYY